MARVSSGLVFRAIRPRLCAPALLLGGLMLVLGGCGPPATPNRGFGSRRILAARDPLLALRSFTGDASGIYLAHSLATSKPALATSTPANPIYDRSLLDLATAEERSIQDAVINANILPGGPGGAWSLVLLHYASDADARATGALPILSFIDETTGERLAVPNVTNVSLGASRADPIILGRYDAMGNFGSWFGPPENLVALPKDVTSFAGFDSIGGIATISTLDDIDGTPSTTLSVMHLPFDESTRTEIVPSALGDHAVVTADGVGSPAPAPAPLLQVVGYSCPRASDAVPRPRCFLLYTRSLPDGNRRFFVRILDDPLYPSEIELPGDNPGSSATSPDGRVLVWSGNSPEGVMEAFSWTVGADHAGTCPPNSDAGNPLWRPNDDGFALLSVLADLSGGRVQDPSSSTWTLVTGTPDGGCRVVASGSNRVASLAFSPDGSLLGRLEANANGDSVIHVSALDGSGDRTLPAGSGVDAIKFLDDRRLQLRRTSSDGTGVSWLDLGTDPAVEHPMAERVQLSTLNSWVWLNPRWLLLGDSYSAADDTFTLAVVDAETGDERIVSTAVTEFRVPWTSVPPDATELPVAYVVRGRVASAQDGVWLARLPLADLPQ